MAPPVLAIAPYVKNIETPEINQEEERLVQVSKDLTKFQEDIKQSEHLLLAQQQRHVAQVQAYKDKLVQMNADIASYKLSSDSNNHQLQQSVMELEKTNRSLQKRLQNANHTVSYYIYY